MQTKLQRKRRLLYCAVARRNIGPGPIPELPERCITTAERYADGLASYKELVAACQLAKREGWNEIIVGCCNRVLDLWPAATLDKIYCHVFKDWGKR